MKVHHTLLSLALFFIVFTKINAQTTAHSMLNIGYAYQNQSFAEVGIRMTFLKSDDILYRLSTSALIGSTNDKFAIMPKLQADVLLNFQKGVDLYHSHYFLVGTEITNQYVAPKLGISFLGLLDVTAGYGITLGNQKLNSKKLKGFNFNFGLNLPFSMISDLLN